MKIPNVSPRQQRLVISLARIVSEDSQLVYAGDYHASKSSKDS